MFHANSAIVNLATVPKYFQKCSENYIKFIALPKYKSNFCYEDNNIKPVK